MSKGEFRIQCGKCGRVLIISDTEHISIGGAVSVGVGNSNSGYGKLRLNCICDNELLKDGIDVYTRADDGIERLYRA